MLRTKVHLPPVRPNLLPRPRLVEKLNEGLQPGLKLTLLSAPAGYGKSTALAQWAHGGQYPTAWLSLEEADDEFERFFRYVALALETAVPEIKESSFSILLGASSPELSAVQEAFINLAGDLPTHTALILEDFHTIKSPEIHQALTFLLDHLSPHFHFVISARVEPPLPLARYRTRGELLEIGLGQLRFKDDETAAFLKNQTSLALPRPEVDLLNGRLEGWIAGLQLASLADARGLNMKGGLDLTGRQRFIADFFREEVLRNIDPGLYDFMRQTSLLQRLSGPLCDAVTGSTGSQSALETLESKNLFLLPLDDARQWFRYHPLFAEFLQNELVRRSDLDPDLLHSRAARWYLQQDMEEAALYHAVAGQDGSVAARIAENTFEIMLFSGRLNAVRKWLDAMPGQWYYQYPAIGLAHAQWYGLNGDWQECLAVLDRIAETVRQSDQMDTTWQMARVNAIQCRIACAMHDLEKAEPLAHEALEALPEDDYHYRAGVHIALGESYREAGRWQEAAAHYQQALSLVHDTSFRLLSAHVYGALADMALLQGQLRDADRYWDEALAVIEWRESWGYLSLPLTGWVYIRKAELLYERNELDTASELVERGLKRAGLGGAVEALIAGNLVQARLRLTRGEPDAAAASLDQAQPYLNEAGFHHWHGRFQRLQVERWLAEGKLRTAVNWSDRMPQDDTLPNRPDSELTFLAVARVLIVKGDTPSLQQSLTILRRLLRKVEAAGQTAVQIEALALQALARRKLGDEPAAMKAIEQSLRLARPQGYLRLFLDFGREMGRLLQEAQARQVMAPYVGHLLSAFSEDGQMAGQPSLAQPLTERETEVLQQIAAGLTNPEIAGRLVIATETVKKHAGSIYAKLNVSNRIEAAARARELGLLD